MKSFRSITTVLIFRTLGWACLCVLLFACLQAWLTYQKTDADFQRALRNIANTNVPLLSLAIWDVEPATIQRQISLLLESPRISYVTVRVNTGQVFEGGDVQAHQNKQARNTLTLTIPQPDNPAITIGSLELIADHQLLYQQILTSVVIVMFECLLLSILILGAVVAILHRDLEQPMRRLADFVHDIKADNLSAVLKLCRPERRHFDEIDLVADGFSALQSRLREHIATLDQQVQTRTEQLQSALAALKELSATDTLTGCYNRMFFNDRFAGELSRAQRYGKPLSVIFCDVDKFKSINDNYGHPMGDQVLQAVGACLRAGLRTGVDWVVRYGGEEFLVVVPETALQSAVEVAQRLRISIQDQVRPELPGGIALSVTASFGVAQYNAKEDAQVLLSRADELLYLAKRSGRNQVQPTLNE